MLDSMNVLSNKLSLQIIRSDNMESKESILDSVRQLLHEQICNNFHLFIPWDTFVRGGKFRSSDNMAGVQIASVSSESRTLWAAKIQERDQVLAKRLWNYHLGIRVFGSDRLFLCYAKCCYDHSAGSIHSRTIPIMLDHLPAPLFFAPNIQCMSGKTPFSAKPLELRADTVADFIDCIQDQQRSHPVLLITCADAISPTEASDLLLGNAIVYWCTDAAIVMYLNSIFPEELFTPWDSVRSFLPLSGEKLYHPCWLFDEIHRMGKEEFLFGLQHAYCASMRSLERKNFLTVEDVYRYQDQLRITELSQKLDKQKAEFSKLLIQNGKNSKEISDLREQLQSLEHSIEAQQLKEYESLLNESMAETDALKKGVSSLCEKLYSTLGTGFKPDETEPVALLQELSQAIYTALACVSSRKG